MPKALRFTEKDLLEKGFVPYQGGYVSAAIARSLNLEPEKKKRKPKGQAKKHSDKIDEFCHLVKKTLGIDLVTEFRFDSIRKWRFDYANEELKLAIECEGGIWSGGRHTRGQGYINDCEKYTQASLQGWKLIRRTPQQLQTEETLSLIRQAIFLK